MRRLLRAFGLGLASLVLASTGVRASGTAERVEVPIQQVRLSNGNLRYWVPVTIGGGAAIKAMLDTGSFGLRILASALSPASYQPTTIERNYRFTNGAQFRGNIAKAVVNIGEATTGMPIPIQVVQSVDCMETRPNCPVSRVSPEEYLIGGDGLPKEGFPAILGMSMRTGQVGMAANNPLSTLGSRAWIVILPRPGDSVPGRLIINPTPTDLVGFRLFQMERQAARGDAGLDAPGWMEPSVPVCAGGEDAPQGACRPTKLDTGELDGVKPYFTFAVLYDQKRGVIGIKPR